MIGTKDLPDVYDVPEDLREGAALLIVAGDQVLGGAIVVQDEDSGSLLMSGCWAVADLQGKHWALLGADVKQTFPVPSHAMFAVRSSLNRFAAFAQQQQAQLQLIQQGQIGALRVLGEAIGTGLGKAVDPKTLAAALPTRAPEPPKKEAKPKRPPAPPRKGKSGRRG